MLRTLSFCILFLISPVLFSCEKVPAATVPDGQLEELEETSKTETMKVKITAGGKSFTADIENSETGKAFWDRLPLTLDMSELNGNEKYCYGVSLPRNDKHYESIAAGDLMLYSGNCIVVFYGAAGGYSYTRIGKLSGVTGLAAALGTGSVSVKFEKQ